MGKGDSLGEFEQLVLLALLRLGEAAYGMRVRREIETRTGREASIGAVYATLDRLATKGLVASSLAEPTAERGGRAKRVFVITGEGTRALRRAQRYFRVMLQGLSPELRRA